MRGDLEVWSGVVDDILFYSNIAFNGHSLIEDLSEVTEEIKGQLEEKRYHVEDGLSRKATKVQEEVKVMQMLVSLLLEMVSAFVRNGFDEMIFEINFKHETLTRSCKLLNKMRRRNKYRVSRLEVFVVALFSLKSYWHFFHITLGLDYLRFVLLVEVVDPAPEREDEVARRAGGRGHCLGDFAENVDDVDL
ncbi:hypothetical protein BSKO_02754 [Bryopsis sp. KO-2023]|nr:hypothetical protein BSKO_02754 [Bryopsis sp. KO-2023]